MHRSSRRIGALVSLVMLLVALFPPGDGGRVSAALDPAPSRAQVADEGPWVVRAYYSDGRLLRDLATWREPWEVNREQGYVVLDVDASGYARLLAMGFRVEIDAALTAQLRRSNALLPGQVSGIPGYPCYRTVEETFTTAENLVSTYPQLVTWVDVGDSWEKTSPGGNAGYDMRVLRITNRNTPGPKPKLFVMSSVHAREYTPAELNTRFAEYLLARYGVDPDVTWLLDAHEIHLLLQANPDGRKKAEAGFSWRKNTNENYCSPTSNFRGADLNRNFAFRWGCCGGSSSDGCSEVYRGPFAASEPETRAIQDYVRAQFPDQRAAGLDATAPVTATGIFLDIHSYSELVLWPWGFTSAAAPNGDALQTLGRKFAYFNGYEPDQAIGLYPTDGTTGDFAYGELGLAAYTFELGTAFFQGCTFFEDTIIPQNMPALIYAAKVARTPYLTPSGPDALDVAIAPATVVTGTVAYLSAVIDDTRFNNTNGVEPTQPISAAAYYLDVPPWDAAATARAMAATDGTFDTSREAVTATLGTPGLAVGRHIVYVRGQDGAGNWGAVSAAFLDVTCAAVFEPGFTYAPQSAIGVAPVTFTGTVAAGSPPLTYTWDFGDGSAVAVGAVVTHVFPVESVIVPYTVTMTATNLCSFDVVQQVVGARLFEVYLPLVLRR